MADNEVKVQFGAETSGIDSGVDEVKSKISEVGDGTPDLVDKFKSVGEAIISAFAVEKIADFIGKVAEAGERLERTAQMTGLSTDELQNFNFAVAKTGGDADTAALTIERLERNMITAASGTGAAAEAFKALGINIQ